jgi:hypothetical protein
MSKKGVKKTQEYRKPRKRVEFGYRHGILGKKCTNCDNWLSLDNFYEIKSGLGGRFSKCKECYKENKRINYEGDKEQVLENNRLYRERHPEKFIEYNRKYQEECPEKKILRAVRRRAKQASLPDDWTEEQRQETWNYFENKCALSGESLNIEAEHALPISIGHGGTTHGNMYPLAKALNISKFNNNIFEWFEANRQRFELSQERFDILIAYLASANAMTVEEYRAHVDWCHANPRSIDEIKEAE